MREGDLGDIRTVSLLADCSRDWEPEDRILNSDKAENTQHHKEVYLHVRL